MTARVFAKLAFLGWLVSWNSGSVFSCTPKCGLPVPLQLNLYEKNQTSFALFSVECVVVASTATPHGACFWNTTTRFLHSKIPQSQKGLIHLVIFVIGCESPTRVSIWNSKPIARRKKSTSFLAFDGPCLVSWEDVEAFGNITDLRGLWFVGATFVGKNSTFHRRRGITDVGQIIFKNQNLHGSFPRAFEQGIWSQMAELKFDNNSLEDVPVQTLQKTMPFLQSLEVTNNRLRSPPHGFPWCPSVLQLPGNLRRTSMQNSQYLGGQIDAHIYQRFLTLDHNRITNLSTHEFSGYLHKLSLKGNGLQVLGNSCFKNLSGLLSLDLSQNSLRQLPVGVFQSLQSVVELRLDFNSIGNISSDVFAEVINLKTLYFSHNKLREIPAGLLSKQNKLEVVHLEGNDIHFINEGSFPDLDSTALKEVYLSKNCLRKFPFWALFSRKLELVDLSDNKLTFGSLSKVLDSVDLVIFSYRHTAAANFLLGLKTKKNSLKLANNRFETVNIDGFNELKLEKFKMVLQVFVIDLEGNPLVCGCGMLATQRWLYKLIKDHSNIDKMDFATWKCSEPAELKGKLLLEVKESQFVCQGNFTKCPRSCECSVRAVDKIVHVNCQGRNLTEFPEELPKGFLELHLENNEIGTIPSFPFLGRITGLYLSHNKLKRLNASSLLGLTNIRELYLDNNKLMELPRAVRDVRFTHLNLQNNFLKCDCHAKWIKYWLRNVTQRVLAVRDILCNTGKAQGQALIDVQDSDFTCDYQGVEPSDPRFYEKTVFKTVSFALVALLILTVLILALIYKFHREVKVFIFTHFNWHPFDRLDDADSSKIYDAFVSYSGLDHAWVWSTLAEKLETRDPPYKLCIHDRDFEVGAPIAENILNSVEQSKRTIMVLSRNFMASEWCLLEFRAAHRRVLEERMRYLIVILLEDLNIDELDSEIQLYMRTNTYLSVDDKWFWPKLFYSMPQKETRARDDSIELKLSADGQFEEDTADTAACSEIGTANEATAVASEWGGVGLYPSSEYQDSYL